MALVPSPARLRRALNGVAVKVVRRLLGIDATPRGELRKVPDDLPRDMLFSQPLTCAISGTDEELDDGTRRATFNVVVRDADGKRCPDLWVEAHVTGPERSATGDTTTSMLGAATFRMAGPAGSYRIEVLDVAAGALEWDREASDTTAITTVG